MATRQRWLTRFFALAGLMTAIAMGWSGCTTIQSIFSPPPAPTVPVAPPAPVPPKKEPVAPAPPPTKKEPEAPQPPKKEPEAPSAKKETPPPPAKAPLPPPAPTGPVAPPAPVPPKKEPVAPAPPPTKKEPEAPQPPKKEPEAPSEKKDSEAPPPVLAPQVGKGDEEQLRRTAVARIQRAEQLVGQLEGKSLTGEQQERLMTVRSLLGSARDALTAKDLTKASNLADKARLLAEELAQGVK